MAIIKSKQIRQMSPKELNDKLNELNLELAKHKAQIIIGGAPENPGKIKELRRTIAKILTIKKEKETEGKKLNVF